MRKTVGILFALLLLVFLSASASAEVEITFSPEAPRVGDYVDVTVTPGREGALGVRYTLTAGGETVSAKKNTSEHYTASFRPRSEAEYTLTATVVYGKKDEESASVTIPVSGTAPTQEGADVVYSQKDGWWHSVIYRPKKPVETLEKGGCAIFSLSHILQRLGFSGEDTLPETLCVKNSRFYIPGRGTDNPGLITQASKDYSFTTQEDLIETEKGVADCLKRGDLLTFMIVTGHIAMADGISDDGQYVHIVDSATGATFERKDRWKTKGHIFVQEEDGSFTEVTSADQLPGIRWFFETEDYGGMAYWMDLHYCAHQGMRLVRKDWLQLETDSGAESVGLDYSGAMITKVIRGEEAVRVPTKDLRWTTVGADSPQVAVVSNKKGANLLDGDGKTLERYSKKISPGSVLTVLGTDDELCYVFWKDTFCYIAVKNVELLPAEKGSFNEGIVSMNGKTAGTAKVTVRAGTKKNSARVAELTIGTPVAVAEKNGDYYLVEGKGHRGWIHKQYLTLEGADTNGQTVDQGE